MAYPSYLEPRRVHAKVKRQLGELLHLVRGLLCRATILYTHLGEAIHILDDVLGGHALLPEGRGNVIDATTSLCCFINW